MSPPVTTNKYPSKQSKGNKRGTEQQHQSEWNCHWFLLWMNHRRPQQTSSPASTRPRLSSSISTVPPSCRGPALTSRPSAPRSCCWLWAGSSRRGRTRLPLRSREEQEERRPGNHVQLRLHPFTSYNQSGINDNELSSVLMVGVKYQVFIDYSL